MELILDDSNFDTTEVTIPSKTTPNGLVRPMCSMPMVCFRADKASANAIAAIQASWVSYNNLVHIIECPLWPIADDR